MDKTREERLMDLGAEIRRKETEVSQLRREFERLLHPVAETARNPRPQTSMERDLAVKITDVAVSSVEGRSLPKRILAIMEASSGKSFRAEDFSKLPGAERIQNVRTCMIRLLDRDHAIERVGRGVYRVRRKQTQTEIAVAG